MDEDLYSLLMDLSNIDIPALLDNVEVEGDHVCSALMIAALNGHVRVVRMLLSKFETDIEQEGLVMSDDRGDCDEVGLLSCAVKAGHMSVIKTLVEFGANVNHRTGDILTPLSVACLHGRLDIVEYLIYHDASVHLTNSDEETCLMMASSKGHLDVVSYVLKKGAKVNVEDSFGCTALHLAALYGHLPVVEELLKHGATMTMNKAGMTPLIIAAANGHEQVFDCFNNHDKCCSRTQRIEALEQLGAWYATNEHYSLEKAYHFLELAMRERYNGTDIIARKPAEPIAAYGNHLECCSLEDLRRIRYNEHALQMEALVLRERFLNSAGVMSLECMLELLQPLIVMANNFWYKNQYDICISRLMQVLKSKEKQCLHRKGDFLNLTSAFYDVVQVGSELPFVDFENTFKLAADELYRIDSELTEDDEDWVNREEFDGFMNLVLFMIVVTALLYKAEEKWSNILVIIYKLNHRQLRTKYGQTFLHLLLGFESSVMANFVKEANYESPRAPTAKLLIRCGADVDAQDCNKNTPLHTIVACRKPVEDLESIIVALIEAGAHADPVNDKGQTPYEAAMSLEAKEILRNKTNLSLKCIAAKAVRKFNISYEGQVPRTLVPFIKMH